MSVNSIKVFEDFIDLLDLIDYSRILVLVDVSGYEEAFFKIFDDRKDLKLAYTSRPEGVSYKSPNTIVFPLPELKYSLWTTYSSESLDLKLEVVDSNITYSTEQVYIVSKVNPLSLYVTHEVLKTLSNFKAREFPVNLFLLIEGNLTPIDRFNLLTFLSDAIESRFFNNAFITTLNLEKYFGTLYTRATLAWGLLVLLTKFKDILTSKSREVFFLTSFKLENPDLILKDLNGLVEVGKYSVWNDIFKADSGYAYLEGQSEYLSNLMVSDLIKSNEWLAQRVLTEPDDRARYVNLLLLESSKEYLATMLRVPQDVLNEVSQSERLNKFLIKVVGVAKEFIDWLSGGGK